MRLSLAVLDSEQLAQSEEGMVQAQKGIYRHSRVPARTIEPSQYVVNIESSHGKTMFLRDGEVDFHRFADQQRSTYALRTTHGASHTDSGGLAF
jgi:hypothetical protein